MNIQDIVNTLLSLGDTGTVASYSSQKFISEKKLNPVIIDISKIDEIDREASIAMLDMLENSSYVVFSLDDDIEYSLRKIRDELVLHNLTSDEDIVFDNTPEALQEVLQDIKAEF